MGKLDVLEFVDLRQKLKENYIDWCSPVCCDARQSNYSFLRAQMQGAFEFSREEGVWIKDAGHDEKCLSLLRLAKDQSYDLVLFPEYCISKQVIAHIAADDNLWPENRKLWVLPCQGLGKKEFDSLIKNLSDIDRVFLLNTACNPRKVISNHFINALFYCFL